MAFIITSMPVGGAETLLVNLARRMNRDHFAPELYCLKEYGPLGKLLAGEIPAFEHLIRHKYDIGIWKRLSQLMRWRRIDAVVTVGAGDKMFWGRLAAWRAGAPIVMSALHSTGWPDGIGRLNRWLTPITDAFIGVASSHGQYLTDIERLPRDKVHVIPNGVDVDRFCPDRNTDYLRRELKIPPSAPVVGIVAALRPEKNHELFLQAAKLTRARMPDARFIIVGDGPMRPQLEQLSQSLGIADAVHFVGTRADIPELLSLCDVFSLTSHNEANPVSILEALATGKPVVATNVGSVCESVRSGETGFLAPAGDAEAISDRQCLLLTDRALAARMGANGRALVVEHWSLDHMVRGYEQLMLQIYRRKLGKTSAPSYTSVSATSVANPRAR